MSQNQSFCSLEWTIFLDSGAVRLLNPERTPKKWIGEIKIDCTDSNNESNFSLVDRLNFQPIDYSAESKIGLNDYSKYYNSLKNEYLAHGM